MLLHAPPPARRRKCRLRRLGTGLGRPAREPHVIVISATSVWPPPSTVQLVWYRISRVPVKGGSGTINVAAAPWNVETTGSTGTPSIVMVVVTVFSPAGKPARSRVMPAQDIPLSCRCVPRLAPRPRAQQGARDHREGEPPHRAPFEGLVARPKATASSLRCRRAPNSPPRIRRTHREPESCGEARDFLRDPVQGPPSATDERAVRQRRHPEARPLRGPSPIKQPDS